MSAKKGVKLSEEHRERIAVSHILRRSQMFALGKTEKVWSKELDENGVRKRVEQRVWMEPHQVTMVGILLDRALPRLQAIEHGGSVEHRHHVVKADPMSPEEWENNFGNPLERTP